MTRVRRFLGNEDGVITTDWVVITACLVVLGIAFTWGIYNTGVAGYVKEVNSNTVKPGLGLDLPDPPSAS